MAPEHLRVGAIILGSLSVALLGIAAMDWSSRRGGGDATDARRSGWWGNVLLFLVSLGMVGTVVVVSILVVLGELPGAVAAEPDR